MERKISIDVLKVFLAFCIIALHGKILQDINPEVSFYLVNGIFRIGVPVFLLVTGYYFFNINNIAIWIKRIAILYVFWMIFYSYFYLEFPNNIKSIIQNLVIIFFGYHHLWYLAGTLLGGLFLWLFRNRSTKFQIISSLTFFLIGVTFQYIGNLHVLNGLLDKIFNLYAFHRNFLTVSYPFMMIGYLINKHKIIEKSKNTWIFLIISIFILYLEVFINYRFISSSESLDGMYSLLLACPLIFIAFYKLNWGSTSKNIATLSTALYLIHPLFQNLLSKLMMNSILIYILTVLLSLLACIILITLNKKFKFIL